MAPAVACIPFSLGPICRAGKGLAMLVLQAIVCALVQRFRVQVSPGEAQGGCLASGDGEGNKGCYLAAYHSELPVVLETRW